MADINTVIVKIQAALAEAQAAAQPPPADVQQNSTVPDMDWVEGSAGTLDVLGHFSSPSGKTLQLSAAASLPAGVTIVGGALSYDGVGSFRTNTAVALNITAA